MEVIEQFKSDLTILVGSYRNEIEELNKAIKSYL